MALTQMQLIQSLGEAMAWFERERQWGVPATELRHLCGRIGELYAALITNGQMALDVNQHGYDVVSALGERISVKTTAMMGSSGNINFNQNSLEHVDRIIILRVNTEEMQVEILLDAPIADTRRLLSPAGKGKLIIPVARLLKKFEPKGEIKTIKEVQYKGYVIRELESGTIQVESFGKNVSPVLPILRNLAVSLNVPIVNSQGNSVNTRQLGSQIIKSAQEILRVGDKVDF